MLLSTYVLISSKTYWTNKTILQKRIIYLCTQFEHYLIISIQKQIIHVAWRRTAKQTTIHFTCLLIKTSFLFIIIINYFTSSYHGVWFNSFILYEFSLREFYVPFAKHFRRSFSFPSTVQFAMMWLQSVHLNKWHTTSSGVNSLICRVWIPFYLHDVKRKAGKETIKGINSHGREKLACYFSMSMTMSIVSCGPHLREEEKMLRLI